MIFKVLLTSILITVNVINARLNAVNEQQYSQLRFRREADNCGEGYKPGTFYGCSDIDECYENETICGNLKCINTEGSYKCVESGKDETATGTIDVITDKEETHAKNTGDCEKGFKRDWFGSCEDIDECSENSTICGSAKCMNTEGGYECEGEVNLETTIITTEDTTALNNDVFTEKTDTHDKKVGYCDEGYERGWFGSCDDIDEC
ncbi:CD97 antigen-like protein, partial [Leptotrombidium deliense]